jgi:hypothetical protein
MKNMVLGLPLLVFYFLQCNKYWKNDISWIYAKNFLKNRKFGPFYLTKPLIPWAELFIPIGLHQFLESRQNYSNHAPMYNFNKLKGIGRPQRNKETFHCTQIFIACSQKQVEYSWGHFEIVLESVKRWVIRKLQYI